MSIKELEKQLRKARQTFNTAEIIRIKKLLGHHIPNNNGSLRGCIICPTD